MNQDIFPLPGNRFGDPVRINRILYAYLDGDPKGVLTKTKSPIPEECLPAMEKLLEAGRQAFGFQKFDPLTGLGAREDEVLDTIDSFWEWCQVKKKNIAGSPASPQPTASPASSPSSGQYPTATNSSSACP